MKYICLYFQVHQPRRLRQYQVLDISRNHQYFDDEQNRAIIQRVAEKCYLPTNQLLLELIKKFDGRFRLAFSISGITLEQFEWWKGEVIDSFKRLINTGAVEILAETYYHSLSSVYSPEEFKQQVELELKKLEEIFGVQPKVFRNTELIYSDQLAELVDGFGFYAVLTEGIEWLVGKEGAGKVYRARSNPSIKILLRHCPLSDDIAFRFSSPDWEEFPLTAEKYARWIRDSSLRLINIFIDYETFGEHQWREAGIFDFLSQLPKFILEDKEIEFITPSQAVEMIDALDEFSSPGWMSWADTEKDLSAWLGNDLQRNAMDKLYELERLVKASGDDKLIKDWRYLGTSDHFYYMSTKWGSDLSVHKYFNPHQSPYYAYIIYMRILNDLLEQALARLGKKLMSRKELKTIFERW